MHKKEEQLKMLFSSPFCLVGYGFMEESLVEWLDLDNNLSFMEEGKVSLVHEC